MGLAYLLSDMPIIVSFCNAIVHILFKIFISDFSLDIDLVVTSLLNLLVLLLFL